MPISPKFEQMPKPNNKFLRLLADLVLPSDPADAAGDLVGPMMAAERVGGKVAKGLVGEAAENFKKFFRKSDVVDEMGDPLRVYHGTAAPDIDEFNKPINWFSEDPVLANDYAGFRGHEAGGGENVIPAYLRAEKPFDADSLGKWSSVGEMVSAISKQAGRTPDNDDRLKKLYKLLRDNAAREESGTSFQAQDFWHPESFGKDGQDAVLQTLKDMGFDSVRLTESGKKTIGVLEPTQIKSATGNRGTYDPNDPSIMKSLLPYLMYGLKPNENE